MIILGCPFGYRFLDMLAMGTVELGLLLLYDGMTSDL
jgi:hypothetical protein